MCSGGADVDRFKGDTLKVMSAGHDLQKGQFLRTFVTFFSTAGQSIVF